MRCMTPAFLASVLLVCPIVTAQTGAESPARSRLVELAGRDAKDCGFSPAAGVSPSGAEYCLVDAFRNHKAAFWANAGPAKGAAITPAGAVFELQKRDGGFTEHRCAEPAIVREFSWERLVCKETYVAPFKAAERPIRVGGGVSRPTAHAHITVPDEICRTLGSGNNTIVEVVVDTDGKVLGARVMTASRQCDVAALESAVMKATFEPGMFNGTPVMTLVTISVFPPEN